MTDRELLEKAAKAAGIDIEQGYGEPPEFCLFYQDSSGVCHDWNPLTDDGDALRLAVKLEFTVSTWGNDIAIWQGDGDISHTESIVTDRLTATRRAIVRAAAAIGKEMKA